MFKLKEGKKKWSNVFFVILIILIIIPQTRKPIQVALQSLKVAVLNPTVINDGDLETLATYNWVLRDENGVQFNFEEYKDHVVLINFWATWCPPCIAEMPSLDALNKDFKGRVKFLFVTNEEVATVQKFKLNKGFQFTMQSSVSKAPSQFETSSIPRTFVISKSGEIVVDETGAVNWNSKRIRELLDRLVSE